MMSSYPDFSAQGYQIVRELGRNREGGRITWLASTIDTSQAVVLKQFCFAQAGSSWSAFNAYDREIEVLKGLKHSNIPSYLGAFATSDGFCMVQEYIDAPSLALSRSFEPDQIKQIALSVLEILVYLQNRVPMVIHRDIKPENILVSDRLEVYLIDFGFARIGSDDVSGSSVFKGTPGFIPPEQLRKPTAASDLYGLGATLICLISGIKSTKIQDLTDEDDPYRIRFRHLMPQFSLRLIEWLEKMVQPKLKDRFVNAEEALAALQPLDLFRIPEVKFNPTRLYFHAIRLGETLTNTVVVSNSVPETRLEGHWEVSPHPSDPPHTIDNHSWIAFIPTRSFRGNSVECEILIDTSQLVADSLYRRHILLKSNSSPETHSLPIEVRTAPLPVEIQKFPYSSIAALFLVSAIGAVVATNIFVSGVNIIGLVAIAITGLGTILGAGARIGIAAWTWIGMAVGSFAAALTILATGSWSSVLLLFFLGALVGSAVGASFGVWIEIIIANLIEPNFSKRAVKDRLTVALTLLTAATGSSLGMSLVVGLLSPVVAIALLGSGVPLATIMLYFPYKRRRAIAKYRQSEQHLIQP